MKLKHLSGAAQYKAVGDSNQVEAIVSVFNNVDHGGERVKPGAFAKSLAKKLPAFVWSHQWDKPIGKVLEAKELLAGDPMLPESLKELGGLYVKVQFFPEIEDSKQAFLKIKNGLIDEFSIGYREVEAAYDEHGVLDLIELDLAEASPVMRGMNGSTAVLSAKDLKFADHAEKVVSDLTDFIDRYDALAEKRGQLSTSHHERLTDLHGKIAGLLALSKAPDADEKAEEIVTDDREKWLALAGNLAAGIK